MLVQDINMEVIVYLLKELPNEKKYYTHSIILAKGYYKYKKSVFNRLKKINQWLRQYK